MRFGPGLLIFLFGAALLWSWWATEEKKRRTVLGVLKTRISRISDVSGNGIVAVRGRAKTGVWGTFAAPLHAEDALCAAAWNKWRVSEVAEAGKAAEVKVHLSDVEPTGRNFLIEDDWGGVARVDPTDGWLEFSDQKEGPELERDGDTCQRIETILKPGETVYVLGRSKSVPEVSPSGPGGMSSGTQLMIHGPGLIVTTKSPFAIVAGTLIWPVSALAVALAGGLFQIYEWCGF